MARFCIASPGWPVGAVLIPPGTIIDTGNPTAGWSAEIARRGLPPPPNAQPLDAATYAQMCSLYGADRVAPVRT
jgi:hypothetical protein